MISQKITYPLVSIMIPTYGQDQYIEQTVKTALSQDYPCESAVFTVCSIY